MHFSRCPCIQYPSARVRIFSIDTTGTGFLEKTKGVLLTTNRLVNTSSSDYNLRALRLVSHLYNILILHSHFILYDAIYM